MGLEGKKAYKVYLTIKNVEYLRSVMPPAKEGWEGRGGLSAVLDAYVARLVEMAKVAKKKDGKMKVKWLDLFKVFLKDTSTKT